MYIKESQLKSLSEEINNKCKLSMLNERVFLKECVFVLNIQPIASSVSLNLGLDSLM